MAPASTSDPGEGPPQVLVLGGGYAGVTAATAMRPLARSGDAEVTLVNDHTYHYLTTLLHHSAVWTPGYEDVAVYLPDLLEPEIAFERGRVQDVDPEARAVEVTTREGRDELDYDVLLLALGWAPRYYGVSGLEEHALVLDDLAGAHAIHGRIEYQLGLHDDAPEEDWRTHIVVGGGGFTGVEVAGELADWRPQLARTFDIPTEDIPITIVEGGETVLEGFDPELAGRAEETLEAKGVDIETGVHVEKAKERAVVLDDGREIPCGTLIWCAGVRASPLIGEAGIATDDLGRARVEEDLRVQGRDDVFAVGDCARFEGPDGEPAPPTAQVATQEGATAGANVARLLQGRDLVAADPEIEGMFVTVGQEEVLGYVTVGDRRLRLGGLPARLGKRGAAYRYLWRIGGPGLAARKLVDRLG